jgi:hemerythrin superfamily protein
MAKSSRQAASDTQGHANKRGNDAAKTGNAASSTAGTGNAQLVQSRPDTTMANAIEGAGLSQQPLADAAAQSAIAALKQDHRRVEGLFSEFESATEERRKQELVEKICTELNIHSRLEEEIFYPACRESIDDDDIMDEAQVEHDAAKLLIADLTEASSDDAYYDAKVKLLSEMIKRHVAEEERPGQGIFAKAQTHNVDNASLAAQLAERKQDLQRRAAGLKPTRAVSFNLDLGNMMEESMARYSDMDRDDRGRFTSGRGGSRSRYDDDDRDDRGRFMSGRGGSRGRDDDDDGRDDRGRFTSGRGGPRGRYYDDDDDRGGRGRGGWFGDSEGHSRAARERWEDDDDRGRYRSRSRYDDDYDYDDRGRGRGGWFGDSGGHSRAARERWEDDDDRDGRGPSRSRYDDDDDRGGRGHGRGGWFGDSEGHARAARSRRDDDNDDRGGRGRGGSRSRSRDDDDDGRGWFGDPRGHAEAARRGWAHRR